jgi:hypothetical protein
MFLGTRRGSEAGLAVEDPAPIPTRSRVRARADPRVLDARFMGSVTVSPDGKRNGGGSVRTLLPLAETTL